MNSTAMEISASGSAREADEGALQNDSILKVQMDEYVAFSDVDPATLVKLPLATITLDPPPPATPR